MPGHGITAITLYGKYLTRSGRGIFIVFCRRSSVCCEKLAIPKLCTIIPALMIVIWITSPLFTVIVGEVRHKPTHDSESLNQAVQRTIMDQNFLNTSINLLGNLNLYTSCVRMWSTDNKGADFYYK